MSRAFDRLIASAFALSVICCWISVVHMYSVMR